MMWSELLVLTPPTTSTAATTATTTCACVNHYRLPLHHPHSRFSFTATPKLQFSSLSKSTPRLKLKLKASSSVEQFDKDNSTTLLFQENENQPNKATEVEESIKVLKNAAKTRKVPKSDVLSALTAIEKAKLDPMNFLETLGGSKSPGRTWMLIFTAEKNLKGGRYFPLTAVQRFDAEAKRIENGVYLGPLGCLTFEGRFSWKKRILAFIFERIRVKIGPLQPLEVSLGNEDKREPNTKDPFFIWFYVDEEIAVARGRSGGTAFWCRCRRVNNS